MGYRVAVAGATGAVGREMLQTLAERNFPADKVMALASSRSAGREVSYGEDDVLTIGSLDKFDFADADIALFSAGGDTAKEVAPKAGAAGCIVIDKAYPISQLREKKRPIFILCALQSYVQQ